MGWLAGKTVYDGHHKKRKDRNDYVNIRVYVRSDIWKMFKAIVNIYGIDAEDAITDALKLYINEKKWKY